MFFVMPVAPTANNAFSNRRAGKGYGRIKTAKYRSWLKNADSFYVAQGLQNARITGKPFYCRMDFPKLRGDLDGRAKLILDFLVSREITPDDKFLGGLVLNVRPDLKELVEIRIWN
jgi:Holliday junction resolvase RusA-like endonuclease